MLFTAFVQMVYRLFINMFGAFVFFFDTLFSIQLFSDFTLGEVMIMMLVFSLTLTLFSRLIDAED